MESSPFFSSFSSTQSLHEQAGGLDRLDKLDDAQLSDGTTASPKSDIATSPHNDGKFGPPEERGGNQVEERKEEGAQEEKASYALPPSAPEQKLQPIQSRDDDQSSGSNDDDDEACCKTESFVSSTGSTISSSSKSSSSSNLSSSVAEELVDNILEALVRSFEEQTANTAEVMGHLRALVALLPQEAAVQALLQLATLKQEPYKARLQQCLHEAGAVVALMAAAIKGNEESQRLAKLALSAISLSSATHLLDREAMPPSPAGLTPLPSPSTSPMSTPSQVSATAHNSDILDPMTSFFAQAITSLQRLSSIDSLSAAELASIPVDIMSIPSGRRSSLCDHEETSSSTCDSAGQSESQEPTRPPSPSPSPSGAQVIQGWAASSYRRGSLGFGAFKKAVTQTLQKVGARPDEGVCAPSSSESESAAPPRVKMFQVLTDEV